MNRLNDKRALIFGADPITLGIAARFTQEGADVTVLGDASALAPFEGRAGARRIVLPDASRETAVTAVRTAIGGRSIQILVIGGGDVPPEREWRSIDSIDLAGLMASTERDTGRALAVSQAAKDALAAEGGSIILLFSPAGLYSEGGWGDGPVGHHAKHGLARCLAAEWGAHQIRVNTLVPFADTPGLRAYRARAPELVDWRISKVAMRRAGDPVRDIGGAAVFLASEDTRYVTGSMVFADGGAFLTTPVIETTVRRT